MSSVRQQRALDLPQLDFAVFKKGASGDELQKKASQISLATTDASGSNYGTPESDVSNPSTLVQDGDLANDTKSKRKSASKRGSGAGLTTAVSPMPALPESDEATATASVSALYGQGPVAVVCRFRPQNPRETAEGGEEILQLRDNGQFYYGARRSPYVFAFDAIVPPPASQAEVYELCGARIVDAVFAGKNAVVMAYGQTSCGKTYTMVGEHLERPANRGLVPRMVAGLFRLIYNAPHTTRFDVRVTCFEIYLEHIRDLQADHSDNLAIRLDAKKGTHVAGLHEVSVTSVDEVLDLMRQANARRTVAATDMNERSSRSHTVFQLRLTQLDTGSASTRLQSLLTLVDLAGSEKVPTLGAPPERVREVKAINLSLNALGACISALAAGKNAHVPYRNSKLTHLLTDSLGKNSLTLVILALSPSSANMAESLSSLRFGAHVRQIVVRGSGAAPKQARRIALLEEMVKQQEQVIDELTEALAHSTDENVKLRELIEQSRPRMAELKHMLEQEQDQGEPEHEHRIESSPHPSSLPGSPTRSRACCIQ